MRVNYVFVHTQQCRPSPKQRRESAKQRWPSPKQRWGSAKQRWPSPKQRWGSTRSDSTGGMLARWHLTLGGFMSAVVIIGNVSVICLVIAKSRLHTTANCFVVSLVVADFLVGAGYPVTEYLCDVHSCERLLVGHAVVSFVYAASVSNLCLMILDRYVAFVRPLRYVPLMTSTRVADFGWSRFNCRAESLTYGRIPKFKKWGCRRNLTLITLGSERFNLGLNDGLLPSENKGYDQNRPLTINPFTPKSDQCQISPAASTEILHHTVWRTWLFIASSDRRWLYYTFSLPHSYNCSSKGWENTLFELRNERVNY